MAERPVFLPRSVDDFIPETVRPSGGTPDPQEPGARQAAGSRAAARAVLVLGPRGRDALLPFGRPTAEVVATARAAASLGAKRSADLVPAHLPVRLEGVEMRLEVVAQGLAVTALVRAAEPAPARLEAQVAASAAVLALLDGLGSRDPEAHLAELRTVSADGLTGGC